MIHGLVTWSKNDTLQPGPKNYCHKQKLILTCFLMLVLLSQAAIMPLDNTRSWDMTFAKVRSELLDIQILNHHLNVTRSIRLTAKHFGVSHGTVIRVLHSYGIRQTAFGICPRCLRRHEELMPAPGRKKDQLCGECHKVLFKPVTPIVEQ
jgi:hypothetical protein